MSLLLLAGGLGAGIIAYKLLKSSPKAKRINQGGCCTSTTETGKFEYCINPDEQYDTFIECQLAHREMIVNASRPGIDQTQVITNSTTPLSQITLEDMNDEITGDESMDLLLPRTHY